SAMFNRSVILVVASENYINIQVSLCFGSRRACQDNLSCTAPAFSLTSYYFDRITSRRQFCKIGDLPAYKIVIVMWGRPIGTDPYVLLNICSSTFDPEIKPGIIIIVV